MKSRILKYRKESIGGYLYGYMIWKKFQGKDYKIIIYKRKE